MAVNRCVTCFYAKMDKELEAPCTSCTGYSNWVPIDMYTKPSHDAKPLAASIEEWFKQEDVQLYEYDTVNQPKHYMLFEEQGIEVRDVIEKLVNKFPPETHSYGGLTVSDYVQMMQYLMRFMDKNGLEDLKKARWYLDKLIDAYEPDF